MNTTTILILLILTGVAVMARYKPADKKSSVTFIIGNLGFEVKGTFSGLEGFIMFDSQTPENSSMNISINANTVNTNNALRDKHLKNEWYFDVKNYPNIHFLSSKVKDGEITGSYLVTGKLNMKGTSKDISIPFTAVQQNEKFLFEGSFTINRKDFGIGGTSAISDEVEVLLSIYAVKA